jgi:OHCU decarboxylase
VGAEAAGVAWLNGLPHGEAVEALGQCCAARAWAERVAALRPFADAAALYAAADRVWREPGGVEGTAGAMWREAFAGHPRLGERAAEHGTSALARRWSGSEQAGVAAADAAARAELATAQREYEARFGHIFLVCASGLAAADMLAALRARMHNDRATELRVAAEEQRKITRLRLERLLTS